MKQYGCIHCIVLGKYLVNETEEDSVRFLTLFAGHYLTSNHGFLLEV